MAEGRRPGGLTALAVINFIFVGSNLLSIIGLTAFFALRDRIPTDSMNPAKKAQIEALQNIGTPFMIVLLALTLLAGVLLLLSGIGYLKQKRVLGRMVGNVYAVVEIISSLLASFMLGTVAGGGFSIGTMIGLIYPVLTLILINSTFRDDLTN